LKENARVAPFGVGERLEMPIYSLVNSASSPFSMRRHVFNKLLANSSGFVPRVRLVFGLVKPFFSARCCSTVSLLRDAP
jgi:hypothetical protein